MVLTSFSLPVVASAAPRISCRQHKTTHAFIEDIVQLHIIVTLFNLPVNPPPILQAAQGHSRLH